MSDALHLDALATVDAFEVGPRRYNFLEFLGNHPDAMSRSCAHGHLTASALIIDPERGTALLMLHRKVGRWLQMGGHCEEGDRSVRDAAAREAREESGIDGLVLTAAPVSLDRHALRGDARDLDHLDVQYLAVAPPGSVPVANDESLGLRWFHYDDVPTDDGAVTRMVEAARVLG